MKPNKKSSMILVLKVLEKYSDEEHYLTQQDIIDHIYEDYDIMLERKCIANSINLLQELDYDIDKKPQKGVALFSRLFDPSEARFINDAIFSSRTITGKQAKQLSKKINACFSIYQTNKYEYINKSTELSRTSNNDIFLNIEIIEEGMRLGKRVSFQYETFDDDGKPCFRYNGFRYIVSPYYLINNFGKYYLLCNYREKYSALQVFRIDYMKNVEIKDDWLLKPIETLNGIENFNIADYLNEHIYLFNSEVVDAKILIENPAAIQSIDDWFGKKAKIAKEDGKLYASIKCNEDSLFYWILQYGDDIKLISPTTLVDRLKNHFNQQVAKYSENN